MAQIHTHYDNLKVTRDAPPEVIRAAYKTLSQRFHPDRNLDKANATRTFQLISLAYEVLSDPVRRKQHDEWIAEMEIKNRPPEPGTYFGNPLRPAKRSFPESIGQATGFGFHHGYQGQSAIRSSFVTSRNRVNMSLVSRYLALFVVAALVLVGILFD